MRYIALTYIFQLSKIRSFGRSIHTFLQIPTNAFTIKLLQHIINCLRSDNSGLKEFLISIQGNYSPYLFNIINHWWDFIRYTMWASSIRRAPTQSIWHVYCFSTSKQNKMQYAVVVVVQLVLYSSLLDNTTDWIDNLRRQLEWVELGCCKGWKEKCCIYDHQWWIFAIL